MKFPIFLISILLSYSILFAQKQDHYTFNHRVDPNEVTIVRDSFGVPHIFGKTNPDAAYGLAWAHSEDDFHTIQEIYLLAAKMGGRAKGPEGAKIDYVHQLLRLDEKVEAYIKEGISAEFLRYIEAYCQGLNDYAATHPKEVKIKKLFPINPRTVIEGHALSMGLMTGLPRTLKRVLAGEYDELSDAPVFGQGSNTFAFRREMTKENKTLLIVNAHQPIEGIASFYEAHIVSEQGMNMHGGVFPGGTTIFHGTKPMLGWAHTSNSFDKVDVYRLKMHPQKKHYYKFDGEWLPLEVRKAKLKVKLFNFLTIGIKKKAYWSKYGATVKTDNDQFYSIRLAANRDFGAGEEWYRLNLVENLEEFREVLDMKQIPMQNITYADKWNNIWFINHGLVPKRNPNYDWTGVLPGDTSATLWTAYYDMDSLPQAENPACGYLYNVNHPGFTCTCDEESPKLDQAISTATFKSWDNNRSVRFRELYKDGMSISIEEIKKIKYDFQLPKSSQFMNSVEQMKHLDTTKFKDIARIIAAFQDWDGSMDKSSKGASIFMLAFIPVFEASDFSTKPFRRDLCMSDEEVADLLRYAQNHLLEHFGTVELPYGQLLRHRRGEKNYPIGGFPDVLCSMMGKPQEDGTFTAFRGEDLIMFMQWDEQGQIEFSSVKAYGASSKPDSPHFNDQMELYLDHKTKPLTFDKEEIFQKAEAIYHPVKRAP